MFGVFIYLVCLVIGFFCLFGCYSKVYGWLGKYGVICLVEIVIQDIY